MHQILQAIDWTSAKLTGASTLFLFINSSSLTVYLGIVVMLSTLVYNGIRIYKEIKNKNNGSSN